LPFLTIANGIWLQLKKASTLDYVVASATAITAADSIIFPIIYGETFHDLSGLSPNYRTEQKLIFYEGLTVGVGNLYMFIRNIFRKP